MSKLSPHGAKLSGGKKLSYVPIDLTKIRDKLREGLKKNKIEIEKIVADAKRSVRAVELAPPNPGIPIQAGWAYLINENEPFHDEIIKTIEPLAILRQMNDGDKKNKPIHFGDESSDQWGRWIEEKYLSLHWKNDKPPKYVLIIGSPNSVPLKFQSQLNSVACVGRIDFDGNIKNLETYVKKIQRIEESNTPINKSTVFFATDHGLRGSCYDPTYYSHHYMEKKLAEKTKDEIGFEVKQLVEEEATKEKLIEQIEKLEPCLVFASALGMSAPGEDLEYQKQVTGTLQCEGNDEDDIKKWLLSADADDIPDNQPFLDGGIFFQYGDFGYGSPAVNDWIKWFPNGEELGIPNQIATSDFISPIPKKLIFHAAGPIAYIGHFGQTLLNVFTQEEGNPEKIWDNRREPFASVISDLLKYSSPVGYAFESMRQKLRVIETQLVNDYEDLDGAQDKDTMLDNILSSLVIRSELQNYMVFGDPAAKLKFQ